MILGVVGDSAAGKTTITRGLVRILGEDQVTAVATDDYHRYDRKQRAERDITPLDPDCNYMDIMAPAPAPSARRRVDPQAGLQAQRRHLRPAGVRDAEGVHGGRGTARLPQRADARLLRRARLPVAARGAAAQVEGSARLLAARLHDRPGAGGARQARARLRRSSSARSSATPTWSSPSVQGDTATPTTSTPSSCCATGLPHPDLSPVVERRRRRGHEIEQRGRGAAVHPGGHRARARPPRSRRRSGTSSTSPRTCAPSASASSRSAPSCKRSESLALVQLLILYHLVTAKAAIATGSAGTRANGAEALPGRRSERPCAGRAPPRSARPGRRPDDVRPSLCTNSERDSATSA